MFSRIRSSAYRRDHSSPANRRPNVDLHPNVDGLAGTSSSLHSGIPHCDLRELGADPPTKAHLSIPPLQRRKPYRLPGLWYPISGPSFSDRCIEPEWDLQAKSTLIADISRLWPVPKFRPEGDATMPRFISGRRSPEPAPCSRFRSRSVSQSPSLPAASFGFSAYSFVFPFFRSMPYSCFYNPLTLLLSTPTSMYVGFNLPAADRFNRRYAIET